MSSARSQAARRRCGPYILEDVIGGGAQGTVYRAVRFVPEDVGGPAQQFVIKVLSAGAHASPEDKLACLHEAEIAARLSHPNIVSPIEACPDDPEGGWIAMEYVDGSNLRMLLQSVPERRLSPQLAMLIAIDVCKAFVAMHELPIVHRDVKSANVLIGSGGFVKLADFGVARFMRAYREPMTAPGGTLQYMAPEQAKGGLADERSDLFSLGVVMYEMLAGCLPVHGLPDLETAERLRTGNYPKLLEVNPGVPPVLADIVTCLMQPKPQHRYQTARALLHAFNQILKGAVGKCTATAPCMRKSTSELYLDVDLCLELGRLARAARRHLTLDPGAVLRDEHRLAQAALIEQSLLEQPSPAPAPSGRATVTARRDSEVSGPRIPVDDATLVELKPRVAGKPHWLRHRGVRTAAATAVAAVALPLGFAGTSHLQSEDGSHALPMPSKVAPSSLQGSVIAELGVPIPHDNRAVDAIEASKTTQSAAPTQPVIQAPEVHEPAPVAQAAPKSNPAPKTPDKQAGHVDRAEAELTIGAIPSANVWIDRKSYGYSYVVATVKAGRHCIGVGETEPKKEACKWIRVREGEHLEILFEDQALASVDRHGR